MTQLNFSNKGGTHPDRLSIIQKLINAYKMWHEFLPHFPKNSRYTLGSKIDSLFIETIKCIMIAKYLNPKDKIAHLKKASLGLDLLKFFLQLSWEIKSLDNKKYIALSEKIEEIGKMIGGWIGKTKKLLEKTPAKK